MAPSSTTKTTNRQRLKDLWTREKICKLIELYRASDCLWNHNSQFYKSKDCRIRAIERICTSLGITKLDYVKKVHNLRNQFNSELKKYEKRLSKIGNRTDIAAKACSWEHFEKLMFLRPIIAPRPGIQLPSKRTTKSRSLTALETHSSTQRVQPDISISQQQTMDLDVDANNVDSKDHGNCELRQGSACNLNNMMHSAKQYYDATTSRSSPPRVSRDQWDAFGELIANEFRNLNSAVSRKKLKRKIMQVMLEVGEEDDQKYTNVD